MMTLLRHDYGGKIPKMIHEDRERLTHPDRPYIDTPYARDGFRSRDGDRQCAILHATPPPIPDPQPPLGAEGWGAEEWGAVRRAQGWEEQPEEAPEWGETVVGGAGASNILAPPAAGPPAGGGSCRMPPHGQACGTLQPQAIVM